MEQSLDGKGNEKSLPQSHFGKFLPPAQVREGTKGGNKAKEKGGKGKPPEGQEQSRGPPKGRWQRRFQQPWPQGRQDKGKANEQA